MKKYINKETLNQVQHGTLLWYEPYGFGLVLSLQKRNNDPDFIATVYWQDGTTHFGKDIIEHDLRKVEGTVLEIVA